MGKPVGMQTMRGEAEPLLLADECALCGSLMYGTEAGLVCGSCYRSKPYREPWWLRLLRWVVR